MISTLKSLWHDEDGLTTVEYALLLALVAVVAIAAWQTLGAAVKSKATTAAASINSATVS